MNLAVADSGGNLVSFQRMDGGMLASTVINKLSGENQMIPISRKRRVRRDGAGRNLALLRVDHKHKGVV